MGNKIGFLKIARKEAGYRPVYERIRDFGEVEQTLNQEDRVLQASRCMDCGVPLCHWSCPLGNRQSEWQDLVYKDKWRKAYENLQETDDFPEFTGRVCPALCEKGCILNISSEPVTIRENEAAIIEKAFTEGYVSPIIAPKKSGKSVAVIGSGPSGLAVANQLSAKGHNVVVFEKDEAIGGLLRFGIPDFKLNKAIIDRRLAILEKQGVEFRTSTKVDGSNIKKITEDFDAVCLAIGSGVARELKVEGRELEGVWLALDFLKNQNRAVAARCIVDPSDKLSAHGKDVLVIGGGDTGSDCVGTAIRQGAKSVTQIEIMPKPPVVKVSSSHKEGCERRWSLATNRFIGNLGKVTQTEVKCTESGNIELINSDMVLLAMGFTNPVSEIAEEIKLDFDNRKNIVSNKENIFVAGDAASGASLVVRAIASGREVSKKIDNFLWKN